ncbi:ABC transporter ATP-binding protein [Fundidesulfovibrio putealis]|uniref:ABC transporter ATP-binding protein n=1 Tax=Fundidesulfovibrio putealis TaxID=270496 RepID=UPI0006867964|nr:ABC transporter ATP-binding protein [Fundidesulfovibrio putealis]
MAQVIAPVLEACALSVHFPTRTGTVRAVDGLNLAIRSGERWCLLGESGCGKSVVAMSLMRLLPSGARIRGQVLLEGRDLLAIPEREMEKVRGGDLAMVFEQPASYLDPSYTVGDQIAEAASAHCAMGLPQARRRAVELLDAVRVPEPAKRARQYPHELSGGMQQRVMIAIALARQPKVLIADEPTTALDLTVQAQILELLHETLELTGAALLLITHDCDVAKVLCSNAAVMYAGQLIETGAATEVFRAPRHPYTQALLSALSGEQPRPIPGTTPDMTCFPEGCRFHPRCANARPECGREPPTLVESVRCHMA